MTEKELQNNLNKQIFLDSLNIIGNDGEVISFDTLSSKYKYFSVVYLKGGCRPCYSTFIEWHNNMSLLDRKILNHTVLFIIQDSSYNEFLTRVSQIESVITRYPFILDQDSKFLNWNSHIPRWILMNPILIDSTKSIKMVGSPFSNNQMLDIFYDITENTR